MTDAWFPRFSPDGSRLACGSKVISICRADGSEPQQIGPGTSPKWLSADEVIYTRQPDGALMHWPSGRVLDAAGFNDFDACAGRWAGWHAGRDEIVTSWGLRLPGCRMPRLTDAGLAYVQPTGDDRWRLVAPDGRVVTEGAIRDLRAHRRETLVWAQHVGGRWETWGSARGKVQRLHLAAGHEYWPVPLSDAGGNPWVLTHTETALWLRPWGDAQGYVVAEGETQFPDAAWTPTGVRVAWSDGQGRPGEALVSLDAPRVDLAAPHVWHPAGTQVDTLPFLVPDYAGTLRCPADGQTLQTVRTGPREVACLKGAPERQERWTWDDTAVYLTYDATDGREGRPWRVTPTPVWCRRVAHVGEAVVSPDAVLVRRTLTGGSEAHPFPLRTTVAALGEHIDLGALGRCRVLVTTWEPGWPTSGYAEHHWWAIRESDGLRWGRVRYEEHRHGVLERAFDFNDPLPDVQLVPAPPLAIPDPTPDPVPDPEVPVSVNFPPRDESLRFLDALNALYRDQLGRGMVGDVHVDREGLAVWMQEYLRLRVNGASHDAAEAATLQEVRYVAGLEERHRPQ